MAIKEAEEHFDRGVHFFRGGFFASALQEFRAVERFDPDFPNIAYFLSATRKKAEEVAGKIVSSYEESFDADILLLSESLQVEGTSDLKPIVEGLLQAGRYQEALEKIETASTLVPDSLNLLLLTANVHRRLGNLRDAEKILSHAKTLYPKEALVLNNLGNVYLSLSQFKAARQFFREAIALDAQNVFYQNNLGALEMQTYNLDEAERIFEHVLQQKPGWTPARRNLENLRARKKELDREISQLRKDFSEHPKYMDVGVNLGRALIARGYFSEGREILETLLAKKPDLANAQYFLGNLYEIRDEVSKSLACFRELVLKRGGEDTPEFKRAEILSREGYLEEAVFELKKVAIVQIDLAASNISVGIRYFEEANWKRALAYFEKAAAINASYPDAFYWKALTKIQMGKKMDAIHDLEQALEINPRYADAHYQLGMLARLRNPRKGQQHLREALSLGICRHFALVAGDVLKELGAGGPPTAAGKDPDEG